MEDLEICHCNNIMKSEIVRAINEKNLKTVEEVQEETTAGKVCGDCVPELKIF